MDNNTKHIVASNLALSFIFLSKESILHSANSPLNPTEKYLIEKVTDSYIYYLDFLEKQESKLSTKK